MNDPLFPGASGPAFARHGSAPTRVPLDLAERLLAGGVVVDTEVTLAAAGVDLLRVRLATHVRPAGPGS